MIAVTRGLGLQSLNARCSKDGAAGMGTVLWQRSLCCMAAIPRPWPSERGLPI